MVIVVGNSYTVCLPDCSRVFFSATARVELGHTVSAEITQSLGAESTNNFMMCAHYKGVDDLRSVRPSRKSDSSNLSINVGHCSFLRRISPGCRVPRNSGSWAQCVPT